MNLRLSLYKRISSAASLEDVQAVEDEARDRFGPPPASLLHLCQVGRIKFLAQKLKIQAVDRVDDRLVLKFLPSTSVQLQRMTALLNRYAGSLTPQGVMTLSFKARNDDAFLAETIAALKEL